MVSRTTTFAFQGVEAIPVDVQVQISSGIVAFSLVGLADKAVAESRERVRAALHAVGLALPARRITVNLAPADLPKEGSHYDLPIALAILSAMGTIPQDALDGMIVMGELALDGAILPVSGALPAAVAAHSMGYGLICPKSSGGEAAWAGDELKIWAPDSLVQFVNHIKGTSVLSRPSPVKAPDEISVPDFKEIKGQEVAKRAFEVAAAGGHHLLMIGPPGAGKSMLAQRMPSLLPPLDPREMLEISMVASIAGEIKDGQLSNRRPFRNPHHSASQAALVGGGLRAKPGEMALAHHGVLFLDELPEFQPKTLESLRQPLETGQTVIARANHHVTYPARFQLIAAMNPCRCGGGEGESACRRGPKCAQDYQARISGPLLDRIDIQIELASVRASDLALPPPSEGSREIALRIARARQIQRERYNALGIKNSSLNAYAEDRLLQEICKLDELALKLLREAADILGLSARGYHRILRVARTLADLDEKSLIGKMHIAEAVSYRSRRVA